MRYSSIQYFTEDWTNCGCWIGIYIPDTVTFDAAENFIRTLLTFSHAGLRTLQLTVFDAGQEENIVSQEHRDYQEATTGTTPGKLLAVFKVWDNREISHDIFIPAYLLDKSATGTVRREKKGKKRLMVSPYARETVAQAVAHIMGITRDKVRCDWAKLIESHQRGLIRMGNMHFPTPRPWESPIEETFWKHAQPEIAGLVAQYSIDRYRVDFAIPEKHIAIELDGHYAHKTAEQRTSDAQRERHLQALGWRVIRFTGTEIHRNLAQCIGELKQLLSI